jgi:hypothetical protein
MQTGNRQVVHVAHRFDNNHLFYDTTWADHSNMDLSIGRHRVPENGPPINVPTDKNSASITGDGEQNWLSPSTPRTNAIMAIRQWCVLGEMCHRFFADFETATGLRSSRVAFCFCFRHSWKTVAQIS